MDETTYKILMGTSAFIVAMLGSMLATTTIPPECGLEKLRKARNILCALLFRTRPSQPGMLLYGL